MKTLDIIFYLVPSFWGSFLGKDQEEELSKGNLWLFPREYLWRVLPFPSLPFRYSPELSLILCHFSLPLGRIPETYPYKSMKGREGKRRLVTQFHFNIVSSIGNGLGTRLFFLVLPLFQFLFQHERTETWKRELSGQHEFISPKGP